MNKVDIVNINMNYHSLKDEIPALKNINFSIKEGEFISIVGPSGCGKSTLLNIIAGIITPSSGEIYIDGQLSKKFSPKLGYMFQRDHLFEWLTVWENICLGLKIQRKLNNETISKLENLLTRYNLYDFRSNYPNELSGGMRQKAALIRTLALNPEVLLLDEPFSALDYQTRLTVGDEVSEIIRKEGKTAIMVTHDISEAVAISSRVVVLSKRPASIKKELILEFPHEVNLPFRRRESPMFSLYFNAIWKELDINFDNKQ